MTGTVLPHDVQLEEAVLGAVLLSNVAIPRLAVDLRLTPEAFYRADLGEVWRGMLALSHAGEPVDDLTVRRWLVEHAGMEKDRAEGLVDVLPAATPAAGAVLSYAEKVIELAEWRQVATAGAELTAAVQELNGDRRRAAEGLLTSAHRARVDTLGSEALADLVFDHLRGNTGPVWPTPFAKLNDALGGGLHGSEVTLLGGWTSHGKSLTTDQLLIWLASRRAKVHLYINEMSPQARALRIAASITGIDLSKLWKRALSEQEWKSITLQLGQGLPFGVTQVTDWSVEDIARDIRFRGWDVCALDLVHRIPFREERDLAHISTTLNAAAQISGCHLILIVQLNEARATQAILPAPVLRDIRGSGMLKNDADNVLFIHRDEEERGERPERLDTGELTLQKCRNGYLTGVPITLEPEYARFSEVRKPELYAA